MTEETLLQVDDLSKKFCRNLKKSLWYGLKDIAGELTSRNVNGPNLRADEFWALHKVSLELKRGECLGLIGPNGSGKSTFLKLVNGLIKPDRGTISVTGRVGALIELGTGFNPILTGRENIYINGSVLGLTKTEIESKLDSIIEFSEIGEYIDSPVQNYSSGMKVRLGFAIAAQMDPDVLLVDEVLAVGDIGFRKKCFHAIDRISKKAAIILVSHAMPQVARVCTKIAVLNRGEIHYTGNDAPEGIRRYYSLFEEQPSLITGNGKAKIHRIELESRDGMGVREIRYRDDLIVHLLLTIDPEIQDPVVGFYFLSQENQVVAQCNSSYHRIPIKNTGNRLQLKVSVPNFNLNPGKYFFSVGIRSANDLEVLELHHAVFAVSVTGGFVGLAPVQFKGDWEITEVKTADQPNN
ncbi:MAG: ABC transporter [Deltaproteobacteria bacterium SG8_13]|nr:MAG: ABC transporter [Deltaproteobacteria bacterium SG8_13]